MICDRLVCGINDQRIQRRLRQEPDLTYQGAYKFAIAMETASKDVKDLQKPSTTHQPFIQKLEQPAKSHSPRNPIICHRCHGNHLATVCRFLQAICRSCGKKGHLAKACRSKPVTAVNHKSTGQRKSYQQSTHQVSLGDEQSQPLTPPGTSSPTPDGTYTLFSVVGKTSLLL